MIVNSTTAPPEFQVNASGITFGLGVELLATAGSIISNQTNSSEWLSATEVEHFLGDPDVLHAIGLVLGTGAIVWGKRLPHMLAAVASISLGLWIGLVAQDRQHFNTPVWGVDLPEGKWFPWVAGVAAGAAAAVLSYFTWKLALALLTGGLVTLLALAACRLANVSPEKVFQLGSNLLSSYRLVGAVVLTLSIIVFFFMVRKCHAQMSEFASAQLGTLLLLSAVSHFAARVGAEAPFSLLDDLARMVSEVRAGNCHLWENQEQLQDPGLAGCDCGEKCRTEIGAWLASSATVLASKCMLRWYRTRKADKPTQEEIAPLAREGSSGPGMSPQVVGAASAEP
ncbi:unnamed protein product [Symbiodinium pilosum]|uniref:DUF4203 domain-containing protein n=1 Tax=Symbiodinium pilosum TaxID=2952 RepID=A0A812VCZ5_SYMPI|nr:unnamed protein product [Symbiodinium pilosum]